MSNGDHVNQVAALALKSKSSVDLTGAASNPPAVDFGHTSRQRGCSVVSTDGLIPVTNLGWP
jgi:hypothetical protein